MDYETEMFILQLFGCAGIGLVAGALFLEALDAIEARLTKRRSK